MIPTLTSFQNLLTQAIHRTRQSDKREGLADFALRQPHPKTAVVRREGAKRLLPEVDVIMQDLEHLPTPAFKEQGGYG